MTENEEQRQKDAQSREELKLRVRGIEKEERTQRVGGILTTSGHG